MTRNHALFTSAAAIAAMIVADAAPAQLIDLCENNAAQWGSFANVDNAATSVVNSTAHVRVGSSSVLFTTAGGFATGARFPSAANANWNVAATGANYLVWWEYAVNTNPNGFQGNQPIVRLKSGSATYTYTNQCTCMTLNGWRQYKMPLAGSASWVRTQTGSPSLSDIDQIEIQHDTWDAGFNITIDGLRFTTLDANSTPPPGPPPPPGVDPDIIESKVLLYIIDPLMPNYGNVRTSQYFNWGDPVVLTQGMISDFLNSSYGRARYEVVETVLDTNFNRLRNGFTYTDTVFVQAYSTGNFNNGGFDYAAFIAANNLGARVDAGELDEVWVYSYPGGGMFESIMAGGGAYWINGTPYPNSGGQRAFPIMGLNFERGVAEAIHSYGHRSENVMVHSYGSWQPNQNTTWNKFTLLDRDAPGLGGVGNVHFPVNGESDYDYYNPRSVLSNASDWLNYPNFTGATSLVSRTTWSRHGDDPQREYLKWWYGRMPHVSGRCPDGYLCNWWRYLMDVNQFKAWDGRLILTDGIPVVAVVTPTNGADVSGVVPIRADAEVDGALGRVDFYIDGAYRESDYLAPYTLSWDTAGLSGAHSIVAKAYELQNGTEAVSATVTVNLPVSCPADYNGSGATTVQDIFDFLAGYFSGAEEADFNGTGGLSVQDIFDFLASYFGSPC